MSLWHHLGFPGPKSEEESTFPLSSRRMTTETTVAQFAVDALPLLPSTIHQAKASSASTISVMATDSPVKHEAHDESDSFATAPLANASLTTAFLDAPIQQQQQQQQPGTPFFETKQFKSKSLDYPVLSLSPTALEGRPVEVLEETGSNSHNDPTPPAESGNLLTNQTSQAQSNVNVPPDLMDRHGTKTILTLKKKASNKWKRGNPLNSPAPVTARVKRKTPDNDDTCVSQLQQHSLEKVDETALVGAKVTDETSNRKADNVGESSGKRRSNRQRTSNLTDEYLYEHDNPFSTSRQQSSSIVPVERSAMEEEAAESKEEEKERKPAKRRKCHTLERETHRNSQEGTADHLFDEVADYDGQQLVKRAVKRISVPFPGSPGLKVYKANDGIRRNLLMARREPNQPLPSTPTLFSSAADTNLRVLYHVTRAHLVNGEVLEALVVAHDVLKSSYAQVELHLPKVLRVKPPPNSGSKATMMLLREKIAGAWCLYAHIFLQIPDTGIFLGASDGFAKGTTSLTREEMSQNAMEDYLWDYAIALLSSCTSCPLAGNHAAITLSLARIRARQRERTRLRRFTTDKHSRGTRAYFAKLVGSAAHWRNNLKLAMQACKSGLQRCLSTPERATTTVTREGLFDGLDEMLDLKTIADGVSTIVSSVQNRNSQYKACNPLESYKTATTVPPEFFTDILNLPRRLRDSLSNMSSFGADKRPLSHSVPFLYTDRNGARLICSETNCLSRLEQGINEFDSSTELQLVCEPEQPEYHGQDVSCTDGVAWDDCLFFQSMNIVLVERTDAERYKFVQKVPSCAVDFFRPAGSSSMWRKKVDIDGYANYYSALVYSDVAHVCALCDGHFPTHADKTAHSVNCRGDGQCFGGHTLHMSWETLPVVSEQRNLGDNSDKSDPITHRVLELCCACKTCCPYGQLFEGVEDIDNWTCHAMQISNERAAGASPPSEGCGEGAGVQEVEQPVNIKADTLTIPLDLKSRDEKKCNDKAAGDTPVGDSCDTHVTKNGNVKGTSAGATISKKPSKRTVRADLKSVFELAVDDDDNETVITSALAKTWEFPSTQLINDIAPYSQPKVRETESSAAGGIDSTLESQDVEQELSTNPIAEQGPPKNGVNRHFHIEKDRRKRKKISPELDVDYACRVCFKPGFADEEDRNLHEHGCRGQSSDSVVNLAENWPTLARNRDQHNSPNVEKPVEEGPTPGKLKTRAANAEGCNPEASMPPQGTLSHENHGALDGFKPSAIGRSKSGDSKYGADAEKGTRKRKGSQEMSKLLGHNAVRRTRSHGNPVVVHPTRDRRSLRSIS